METKIIIAGDLFVKRNTHLPESEQYWEKVDAELYLNHYVLDGEEYEGDLRQYHSSMNGKTTYYFDYYNLNGKGPYLTQFKTE